MSARLSGSGLLRATLCPASYALPAVETESKATTRGREVHAFLEDVARGIDRDEALLRVPLAFQKQCAAIESSSIPRGEPEVALAFDLRSGEVRRLKPKGHRDYSGATSTEITGTADLLIPPVDGRATVVDWKTTSWDLDPDAHRSQLAFYGLCTARLYDCESVKCAIAEINPEGQIEWHSWTLDFEDLNDVANQLRDTVTRVEAARSEYNALSHAERQAWTPDVTEGAHCRCCPAWRYCPAKVAAVSTALGVARGTLSTERERIGQAWVIAREAARAQDVLRPTLEEALEEHGGTLETGDGQAIYRDSRGAIRVASEAVVSKRGRAA